MTIATYNPQMETTMLNTLDVEGAARDLAQALAAAKIARDAGANQHAHVGALTARLHGLQGERASIVARRRDGLQEDSDAARLALIAADLEGLTDLLARANAGLARHTAAIKDAQRQVEKAEFVLHQIEAQNREGELLEYVASLERALLEVLPKLADARKALGGGRPRWVPSPALYDGLRRLDLQGGWRQ